MGNFPVNNEQQSYSRGDVMAFLKPLLEAIIAGGGGTPITGYNLEATQENINTTAYNSFLILNDIRHLFRLALISNQYFYTQNVPANDILQMTFDANYKNIVVESDTELASFEIYARNGVLGYDTKISAQDVSSGLLVNTMEGRKIYTFPFRNLSHSRIIVIKNNSIFDIKISVEGLNI